MYYFVRFHRIIIYLLPNVLTTASLFAGYYAIIQSTNCQFVRSSIAIFIAILFDCLDGRIARFTKTESSFGAHYDSLSDMVSFGIAPSLLIYEWILRDLGTCGWLASFIYIVGAAFRLARFNSSNLIKDFFQGLPSPAAAALISGFVWLGVYNNLSTQGTYPTWFSFFLTIYAGLSMITSIRFYNGKNIQVSNKMQFCYLIIVNIFIFTSSNPPIFIFLIFILYSFSGWIGIFWNMYKNKNIKKYI